MISIYSKLPTKEELLAEESFEKKFPYLKPPEKREVEISNYFVKFLEETGESSFIPSSVKLRFFLEKKLFTVRETSLKDFNKSLPQMKTTVLEKIKLLEENLDGPVNCLFEEINKKLAEEETIAGKQCKESANKDEYSKLIESTLKEVQSEEGKLIESALNASYGMFEKEGNGGYAKLDKVTNIAGKQIKYKLILFYGNYENYQNQQPTFLIEISLKLDGEGIKNTPEIKYSLDKNEKPIVEFKKEEPQQNIYVEPEKEEIVSEKQTDKNDLKIHQVKSEQEVKKNNSLLLFCAAFFGLILFFIYLNKQSEYQTSFNELDL